jgi:hypothetical protein
VPKITDRSRLRDFKHVPRSTDIGRPGLLFAIMPNELQRRPTVNNPIAGSANPVDSVGIDTASLPVEITLQHHRPRKNLTSGLLLLLQDGLDSFTARLLLRGTHQNGEWRACLEKVGHQLAAQQPCGPREKSVLHSDILLSIWFVESRLDQKAMRRLP